MIRPSIELAIAINREIRHEDEWFEDPDELDRLSLAIQAIDEVDDPIEAAALLAYRVTRAQAFGEGNKRTALLLARWTLDRNGLDGSTIMPSTDNDIGQLLIRAAAGGDVLGELNSLLQSRRPIS